MIVLEVKRAEWLDGQADNPHDYCSHGIIDFRVNDLVISAPKEEWCTSATALFLLRTVFANHDQEHPVAVDNYLVACCGHGVFPNKAGPYDVLVTGCNSGIDPTICHKKDLVVIELNGETTSIGRVDWVRAVVLFAEQVEDFYQKSAPKDFFEDDCNQYWWDLFWQEWQLKKAAAKMLLPKE